MAGERGLIIPLAEEEEAEVVYLVQAYLDSQPVAALVETQTGAAVAAAGVEEEMAVSVAAEAAVA